MAHGHMVLKVTVNGLSMQLRVDLLPVVAASISPRRGQGGTGWPSFREVGAL